MRKRRGDNPHEQAIRRSNRQHYGKVLEAMENEELRQKDPLPKNVSDTCQLLNQWQNNYGGLSIEDCLLKLRQMMG